MPQHYSTLAERIARNISIDPETGCWNWLLVRNQGGYGRIMIGGKMVVAHRISYEAHIGPIPEGLSLDHLCRNRACCNPSHLEPVSGLENTRRGNSGKCNREKTHCKYGHPFDEANTWREKNRPARQCRECNRIKAAKRRNRAD